MKYNWGGGGKGSKQAPTRVSVWQIQFCNFSLIKSILHTSFSWFIGLHILKSDDIIALSTSHTTKICPFFTQKGLIHDYTKIRGGIHPGSMGPSMN